MAMTSSKKSASATPTKEAKPAKVKGETVAVKKVATKKVPAVEPKVKAPAKGSAKAKAVKVAEPVLEAAPAVLAPTSVPKRISVPVTLPPLAGAILTAIQEGRALEFIFADAEANAPRTFEPRHLTFDALSQAWYVWGWDRRYNAERHHRVDLLAEVNDVEGAGRAAQGPYAEGTPANLIGGWLGGEPIPVKATLLKQWVFAIKQAPPAFPNFKLEDQGDGQALVSFTATDLRAIARWAMQFGDGISVLEPARLVDRVKQVGAVWAGRDRQPSAPAPKQAQEPRRHEGRSSREPRPDREETRTPSEHRPDREQTRTPRESRPEREREEVRAPREPRPEREEAPKSKPGKVEIVRFDRL